MLHPSVLLPLLAPLAQDPQASEVPPPSQEPVRIPIRENSMRVSWRDNLRFETEDRQFMLQLGGRIHLDGNFAGTDDQLTAAGIDTADRVAFRRARLHAAGTLYESIDFYAAYEFSTGEVESRGIYLRYPELFGGDLLVGNFKEPFSLEWLTSSNYLTFLERGLPFALTPGYQTGAMWSGERSDGALTWALGLFRAQTDPIGESVGDGDHALTGRLTYAFDEVMGEEDTLFHLGAAYSIRSLDTYGVAQFPEGMTPATWVSTGSIPDVDGVDLLGLEAAAVFGPLSFQGEYISSDVDAPAAGDPTLDGWYAMASYFLTGETRPYRRGTFGRVRPYENWLGFGQGSGALEIAARYSVLDLEEAVPGEKLENVSVGLNWYLNPAARIMTNWVLTDVESASADTSLLGLRFQVTF